MNQRNKVFNPTGMSPWTSSAPKSMPRKRRIVTQDENNNVKQPRQASVTRFVGHHEPQVSKEPELSFHAHSGYFHSYYEATKRSLLEQQLKQQKALELEASMMQRQTNPTPVLSNEVIEIPDSPTKESGTEVPLEESLLRHCLESPKMDLMSQSDIFIPVLPWKRFKFENYFAPMQFMSAPESLRSYEHNSNPVEGVDNKAPDRVGVVIKKREQGYESWLL